MAKKKAAEAAPTDDATKRNASQQQSKPLSDKKTSKQAAAESPDSKPASTGKKRAKDEIDAIFGSKKKKEIVEQHEEPGDEQEVNRELQDIAKQVAAEKAKVKKPKVEGSKDDIFGEQTGAARKRTAEGYAIYGEDELGLGKKGGDTPLCPFDCDCCY
eukprot:GHUV01005967.1.p1 GENE.GHUV01005967.1~~GHUV01005967.1.p1  ORF type:complete len:158 (+),score=39.64 GHUV01005967.1:99-572(+)